MDHSRGVVAVLLSPQGQAAVAAGQTGTLIRLLRKAAGWNQEDLANRSGYSQATISRLERGMSRAARDTVILADVAEALGAPPAVLGVVGHLDQRHILDGVERRVFFSGAAGLAVAVLLPHSVVTPGRIDAANAAQCWAALRRLEELDALYGGAAVYQVAEGMVRALQEALRQGSYPPEVGRDLQGVTAAAMDQAGWLAYDAGWHHKARQWWLETCHRADLAGITEPRVSALAALALQAINTLGGGQEAVELVHAARTAAKEGPRSSPTLLSLLAAREAVGYAQTGDRVAAVSAMSQASQWLDHGRQKDGPFWLDFWGPADLAWHETQVALATRNGKSAALAARSTLSNADAGAFPRNHTLYIITLASVLTRLGQLDEAISLTSDAIQGVREVQGSGYVITNLRRTVDLLEKQKYPPATMFAAAARRLVPASQ